MMPEFSRRDFLKGALAAVGIELTKKLPEWILSIDDTEFQELITLCTEALSENQVLDILDENLDYDDALMAIYAYLIANDEDPNKFLILKDVLESGEEWMSEEYDSGELPIIIDVDSMGQNPEVEAWEQSELRKPETPTYPFSIFEVKKVGKKTQKLLMLKELLMPELTETLGHIKVRYVEIGISHLLKLEQRKRISILATIHKWEQETGLKVKFTGVIGKASVLGE